MSVFDFSDVLDLAADLADLPDDIGREVPKVVKKALNNVKAETREVVSGHPSWRHIAGLVAYDMDGPTSGEVGYADVGQGELAGIYEFGSARRAPHPTLIPAAEAEAPRFVEAISDTVKDWLR